MILFNQRKKPNERWYKMLFKDLRSVWSGMVNVSVFAIDKAPLTIEDYPFDMVQKRPWLDNCEVRAIEPDAYIQRDGHSSCVVKLDYRG